MVQSRPASSPNTNDRLTLKKLKVLHSQGSESYNQIPVHAPNLTQMISEQIPKPTQPATHLQTTTPSTIPTPPIVVDFDDSDEERGIQANIFNKISSAPVQTIVSHIPPRAEQSELPITEKVIK